MALSRGIADTSVFIARESGRPILETSLPDELAVSVITIGELRAGVLAAADDRARDQRLATLTAALSLGPVPIDEDVAAAWSLLRLRLRDQGLSMGVNDSWIAATAISLGVALVTQDQEICEIDDLNVIRV